MKKKKTNMNKITTKEKTETKEAFERAIDRIEQLKNTAKLKQNLSSALMYGLIFGLMASFVANTTYNDIVVILPSYWQLAVKVSAVVMLFVITSLFYFKFLKSEKSEKELENLILILENEKKMRTEEAKKKARQEKTEKQLEAIVKVAEKKEE